MYRGISLLSAAEIARTGVYTGVVVRPSGHVVLAASRGKRLRITSQQQPEQKRMTLNVRTRRHSPGSRAYRSLRLETRGGTRIQECPAPYSMCRVMHVTRPPSNSQSSRPGTYVRQPRFDAVIDSNRLSATVSRFVVVIQLLLFVGSTFRQPSSPPTTITRIACASLAYPPARQPTFYEGTKCRRSWRCIGAVSWTLELQASFAVFVGSILNTNVTNY